MKQLLFTCVLLTSLFAAPQQLLAASDSERSHTLKVYNWADYIDPELLTEFEEWYLQETGEEVHIIYQLFDINEIMLAKIEKGHEDYDVVCPSEYIIERMLKKNLLLPINRDFGNTPDYTQYVSAYADSMFNEMSVPGRKAHDYAVGYMWGTTGILYNTAYVSKEEVQTWGAVWNPRFEGKVLMKDAFRDVYGSLMMYVRQDELRAGTVTRSEVMNSTDDRALKLFEDTMIVAKKNFAGWEVDFGKERMVQGKAWLNVTWSGDAVWAIDEVGDMIDLDYTIPVEGSNVWFDGWVIPKYAKNTKAASYFINFMCKPENAIRNMNEIGYVSVIASPEVMEAMTSEEYPVLDLSYFFGEGADSIRANHMMYPDASTIERLALMHDCGENTEKIIDMWSRIKGDSLNLTTIIVITVVLALIIVYSQIKRNSRKKKNKSKRKH